MAVRTDTHRSDKHHDDCILVINSGSSTVKYQLLDIGTETVWIKGMLEIGQAQGKHLYHWRDGSGQLHENRSVLQNPTYSVCFAAIAKVFTTVKCPQPSAIGHRVVHGGEDFVIPTLITPEVLAKIEQLSQLAPLHNPANEQGICVCLDLFPNVPQVAVFDTAFHQTMPDYVYRYPLPDSWYSKYNIRRYGFHGSSHRYVSGKAAEFLQKPLESLNLITLHLGNGASIAAIEHGLCIDTSMGFTPLEGLMMGTRCGDIDPSIPLYMQQATNMSVVQVSDELNHHSGLLGLTGSQDMRELLNRSELGDQPSELAISMYCYRIKKYIGAYIAALGQVDALVFTGGVGENAADIRTRCCNDLNVFGIAIDHDLNRLPVDQISAISPAGHSLYVLVIRTNEELQIAQEVVALLNQ